MKKAVGFIGGGNMAKAILSGLSQKERCFDLYLCDRNEEKRTYFQQTLGVTTSADYRDFIDQVDILILAIKPQGFPALLAELKPILHALKEKPLIISIAAGVSIEAILRGIDATEYPIIRVMPNTPSTIGLGASALYANEAVSKSACNDAGQIFASCGITTWLASEELISAAVAVSGSSPAYLYYLMDIMSRVGVEMGLTPENSKVLTQQAVLGSARYSQLSDLSFETLKRNVMSPQGTTEQAIFSLEKNHFDKIIEEAMRAAFNRDQELSELISEKI